MEQQYSEAVFQRCSMKKDVLGNFTKFTGKHLCQSLFFSKVAGLKFLRTSFLQNNSGRLLLSIQRAVIYLNKDAYL